MVSLSHIVVLASTPFVLEGEPQLVNNERVSIAHQIRRWRTYRGLTQEGLALACGWSGQSRVSNYENPGDGGRNPSVEELPLLARALGITLDELFFGDPGAVSQTVRLDVEKLQTASIKLITDFGMAGLPAQLDRDMDLLALAYEREMMPSDDRVSATYAEAVNLRIDQRREQLNELRHATRGLARSGASRNATQGNTP